MGFIVSNTSTRYCWWWRAYIAPRAYFTKTTMIICSTFFLRDLSYIILRSVIAEFQKPKIRTKQQGTPPNSRDFSNHIVVPYDTHIVILQKRWSSYIYSMLLGVTSRFETFQTKKLICFRYFQFHCFKHENWCITSLNALAKSIRNRFFLIKTAD